MKRIKTEVVSILESIWANLKPQITSVLNKASDHVLALVIASVTVGAGALTAHHWRADGTGGDHRLGVSGRSG